MEYNYDHGMFSASILAAQPIEARAFDHVAQGRQRQNYISTMDSALHCDVCNLTLANADEVTRHCTENSHRLRASQVEMLRENPSVVFCAGLQRRISQLTVPLWQQEVHASLYWVLMNQVTEPSKSELTKSALAILTKYEQLDRFAVLELVVWRAMCVQANTRLLDYYEWHEWNRHGWKQRKADLFRCTHVCIIVTLVRPFLDEAPDAETPYADPGIGEPDYDSSDEANPYGDY